MGEKFLLARHAGECGSQSHPRSCSSMEGIGEVKGDKTGQEVGTSRVGQGRWCG